MKRLLPLVLLIFLLVSVVQVPAMAEDANLGFEDGNLGEWSTKDIRNGMWNVYSGTPSVCTGAALAPEEGTWAAVSATRRRGVHFLYRDITLPSIGVGGTMWINASAAYKSGARLAPKRNFDISHPDVNANQQFRIDLMYPSAPLKSMERSDIAATVFSTKKASPKKMGWTLLEKDITDLGGQTLRLRIAQVSNQGCLNAMVDNFGYSAII